MSLEAHNYQSLLNPVSIAWSDWEYNYPPSPPLDGMLVHHKVTPQHYLYTWVERDNVEQRFLSKETTWWQRPGLNHSTTATPQGLRVLPGQFLFNAHVLLQDKIINNSHIKTQSL